MTPTAPCRRACPERAERVEGLRVTVGAGEFLGGLRRETRDCRARARRALSARATAARDASVCFAQPVRERDRIYGTLATRRNPRAASRHALLSRGRHELWNRHARGARAGRTTR